MLFGYSLKQLSIIKPQMMLLNLCRLFIVHFFSNQRDLIKLLLTGEEGAPFKPRRFDRKSVTG
ncbi:MAG: hypothetical protein AMJ88_12460 [Anaerolineae bacterium SM23_ 63]|nr:MAG: hypothetical protein AMJ88_12460 [Anaerolineae bacterium SM23_ 63]